MTSTSLLDALRAMGLVGAGEPATLTPLAGGVSSDIYLVEAGARRFCVKRALARLKVAAFWEAPLHRNAAEAAWMRHVGRWLPQGAPAILGEDAARGLFAMTYLPPERNPVWKEELLKGAVDLDFSAAVGRDLALIHARSAADPEISAAFANDSTFEMIRLEPYLRATAVAHPELSARLNRLADVTLGAKIALVHGDVSPKNILHSATGPVFLDAECAWCGDPAFDLAFCLNHLLLKGARAGASRALYGEAFMALSQAYLRGVTWEPVADVERRAGALLPALFLARVDGKSPVEYLTTLQEKDAVRRVAIPLIAEPAQRIAPILKTWISAP